MEGWISLHRKLQNCDIWLDEEPFDRRSAWIDLLLSANHEDKGMIFDGHRIIIKRGQLITSVRKLSSRWHWGKNRTLAYLRLLEELEMIERDADSRRTLLTIVNYGVYQNGDASMRDSNGTVTGHSQATNNNDNNDNNKNNIRFVPPTVEEVREYCLERKNNIDPVSFVSFYSSKGWMIGKNKMKDWKAAVRTWEQKEKEKPATKKGKFDNFNQRKYDYDELMKGAIT